MHYFLAFFGSLLYNVLIFVIAKNKADALDETFLYGKYFSKNWDNWLLTAMCAPVLVWYMPDIIGILNDKTDWALKPYEIYNLGAGVFTELLYVGAAILFGWKEKFIPKAH